VLYRRGAKAGSISGQEFPVKVSIPGIASDFETTMLGPYGCLTCMGRCGTVQALMVRFDLFSVLVCLRRNSRRIGTLLAEKLACPKTDRCKEWFIHVDDA